MTEQVAFTVLVKIKPGECAALEALLTTIGDDIEDNATLPFARLSNVHFARFVILGEAKDVHGRVIHPRLVFASCVDAPLSDHLRELTEDHGQALDQIYGHCEGYPAPGERTPSNRRAYLQAHAVPSQAFYVNTIGRTVRQVRQEAQLRDAIEGFLDRKGSGSFGDATRARAAIKAFVEGEPSLRWASVPAAGPTLGWRLQEKAGLLLTLLVLVALAPLALLLLPLWLLLLRWHEQQDAAEQDRQNRVRLSSQKRDALAIREDQVVQNQFSAVGNVKPGWFRALTLRGLLWAVTFTSRHFYNRGDLGTVTLLGLEGVDTIHFAQWILIDEGRRLLFLSNYDGSLTSYMDDFINKVAWGLNGVFGNGVGYPKTRWLVLDGANDEQAFKVFLQEHQILTQAWYAGYKQLTAVNLTNNAQVRAGFYGNKSEPDTIRWLRRL